MLCTISFLIYFIFFENNGDFITNLFYWLSFFFFIYIDWGKFAPLTEAVQGLFETSYESIQVYPKLENSEIVFLVGQSTSSDWIINDKLRNTMRFTDWGIFLARCLEKINKTEWGEKSITKEMLSQFSAVRCLGLSTVNCILPQSRGLTMEQDELLLTINSLEQLLIKSKLR